MQKSGPFSLRYGGHGILLAGNLMLHPGSLQPLAGFTPCVTVQLGFLPGLVLATGQGLAEINSALTTNIAACNKFKHREAGETAHLLRALLS